MKPALRKSIPDQPRITDRLKPIHRILVATDFSACADAAAKVAAPLARQYKAQVHVLTVVDTAWIADASGTATWRRLSIDEVHHAARHRLRAFAARHFGRLKESHIHVCDGGFDPPRPSVEVLRVAKDLKCDLIVLGTHGRSAIDHLLLGSVAEKTVRASTVPVLTVRSRA
jgi:nucleotide-binding universal stress UspA family protein